VPVRATGGVAARRPSPRPRARQEKDGRGGGVASADGVVPVRAPWTLFFFFLPQTDHRGWTSAV